MVTTRIIELAMAQYAQDHDGRYPTGSSSTEVFQKLLDEGYVDDPRIFFLEMPGKTTPWPTSHSYRLKPEYVGYDVTADMTTETPEWVPAVLATGYRVDYAHHGKATPLPNYPLPGACADGLPICFRNGNAWYMSKHPPRDVTPVNLPPTDADLGPGPYTQLTPDGPLAAP